MINPADVYRLAMPMSYRRLVVAGMLAMSLLGLVMLVMAQITGFHEVIARIETANPTFEVVGL